MENLNPDGAMAKIMTLANKWEARARRAERSRLLAVLIGWAFGATFGLVVGLSY